MRLHIFSDQVHPVIPTSIWHDRYTLCGRAIRKADIPRMHKFALCKQCERSRWPHARRTGTPS